jgi:hypothetical protein
MADIEFDLFQETKHILIRHSNNAVFEDEEGNFFPSESNYFAYMGNEFNISPDCRWLIVYCDGRYIEKLKDHRFLLTIENHQYMDVNLTALERKLYEWSYVDDPESTL